MPLAAVPQDGVFGGLQHAAGIPLFRVARPFQLPCAGCLRLPDVDLRAVAAHVDCYVSHILHPCWCLFGLLVLLLLPGEILTDAAPPMLGNCRNDLSQFGRAFGEPSGRFLPDQVVTAPAVVGQHGDGVRVVARFRALACQQVPQQLPVGDFELDVLRKPEELGPDGDPALVLPEHVAVKVGLGHAAVVGVYHPVAQVPGQSPAMPVVEAFSPHQVSSEVQELSLALRGVEPAGLGGSPGPSG